MFSVGICYTYKILCCKIYSCVLRNLVTITDVIVITLMLNNLISKQFYTFFVEVIIVNACVAHTIFTICSKVINGIITYI